MRFQTTSGSGLAQCALDAHQSECALGVNAPNRIRCASNSLHSASVNGPLDDGACLNMPACRIPLCLPILPIVHESSISVVQEALCRSSSTQYQCMLDRSMLCKNGVPFYHICLYIMHILLMIVLFEIMVYIINILPCTALKPFFCQV